MAHQITVHYLDADNQGRGDVYLARGSDYEATVTEGTLVVTADDRSALYAKDRWIRVAVDEVDELEDEG